jgi:hypothetical protein
MRTQSLRRATVLSLGLASLLLGGCPLFPSEPPPAAVLEGDWFAELDDGGEVVFTFDDQGDLTRIRAMTATGATVDFNASQSTTMLTGDQVTIRVPLGDRGTSTFEGTLSADQNTMEGALSQEIVAEGVLTVTIPGGDLTLTRTSDCDNDGEYDHREIAAGASADCNGNGVPDECDIADGTSQDANGNAVPDECEVDCNENGVADDVDISAGTSQDCNENGVPDECDIADGVSTDTDSDGVPDECEAGDDGSGTAGDATDGAAVYAANCAACHGADASGGAGPAIQGFTADQLNTGLASAVHASISLSDQEVADMAAWLSQ